MTDTDLFPPAAPTAAQPLLGRTALVTGASRGIGAAVARRLDAAGARVAVAARSGDDLRAVAGALRHDPVVLEADLGDAAAAAALGARATDALGGRVDVLVNNAGVFAAAGPSAALTGAAIDALFAANVRHALLLGGALAAHMAGHGGGSVVNVSSAAATRGTAFTAAYTATKGALDAATRALAAEHGPAGVRVNAVLPGITETSMTGAMFGDPEVAAFYTGRVALGRIGRPEDVAEVVAFLASDAARYVTAQTIRVDGGWADTGAILPPPA
jgi:NAD(P)-dependent dehydrogenase (short-subunit alcohol dehydrogenase family)